MKLCWILYGLLSLTVLPASAVAAPPVRLTDDGRLKSDPVTVDGGRAIVYTVQEKYNQLCLMRLQMADRSVERLHPEAGTSEYAASFSADGRFYAYMKNNGNLHTNLVIHDTKTAAAVEHNPGGGFAAIRNTSVSPGGKNVLFAFPDQQGSQQIFAVDISGKNRRAITGGEAFDACPRYSADGRWIAFSSTRSGNFDIYLMRSDGSAITQLTEHKGLDTRPAWSPDGRRLAFTSLRGGNYDIYLIDADGSNLRRLTTHAERDDHAWWHPDGQRLVVVSERDGRQDLYLVDAP